MLIQGRLLLPAPGRVATVQAHKAEPPGKPAAHHTRVPSFLFFLLQVRDPTPASQGLRKGEEELRGWAGGSVVFEREASVPFQAALPGAGSSSLLPFSFH